MARDRYVFYVRPAESDTLPKEWWEKGAFAPYAIVEASPEGLRVIQPSLAGQLARLAGSLGVGLGLLFGVFLPTAFLAAHSGVTYFTWFVPTALVLIVVALPLGVLARKLIGWRARETDVRLTVMTVTPGIFRHTLQVEGGGQVVWLSMVALRGTLFTALQLTHQHPTIGRS